jgi:hypothetical protein
MPNSFYSQNLAVLKRHLGLYNFCVQYARNWKKDSYALEASKSEAPTLTVKISGQKPVSYHSRYDPVKEAKRQVDSAYENQTHVLLLGGGLCYAAEEILKRLPQNISGPQLFVVEPDPGVFLAALTARDLTSLLQDSRVAWCVGMSPDQIGDFWNNNLDWSVMEKLSIVDHPPSVSRFRPIFERVVEKVRYLCNRSKGNLVTLMHAGTDFHTNNFSNLAASFTLPGVARLFDRFANVPVIVVAAGPSLDKNMHLLKRIKGKFPIVAVDTALRQLSARGILPDIVCAADPSYENSLDFVGVENVKDVVLAIEPMTHPDIFANFSGPKMLMTFGGGLYPIYEDMREEVGKLICWGSIATSVYDLALKLGADPLVFVGLDLSFQDGRLHAKGSYSDDLLYEKVHAYSSIEHETADYVVTRGAYKIVKQDNSVLYTDQNMKLYKDWFEDQFRQTDRTIINATEGGAVDRFVKPMTLESLIEKYADKNANVKAIIESALSRPVSADVEGLIKKLENIKKRLNKNSSMVRKAAALVRRLLSNHREKNPEQLGGAANAEFYDVLKLHDELCTDKEVFPWLSVHQAKFMTRHIMKVNNLKSDKNASVGKWLGEIAEFFVALEKFDQYQIPLLESALEDLKEAGRSKQKIGACST